MAGILSIDTETTGLDFHHAARPFFVTTCDAEGVQQWWEWCVDPETREVRVPPEDIEQIATLLREADLLVLQNATFDATALASLSPLLAEAWDWSKVRDTLLAGHLLASNRPHDLTSMGIEYLGCDIGKHEKALKEACVAARRWARSHHPTWKQAKKGQEGMPSAKGDESWRNDLWLPQALALHECISEEDPARGHWWTVLSDYANADSGITLPLWMVMERELKRRKLEKIYAARLKLLPIAYEMQWRGVTERADHHEELRTVYQAESDRCGRICSNIALGFQGNCPTCKGGGKRPLDRRELTAARRKAKKAKEDPTQLHLFGAEDCPACLGGGRAPFALELPKSGKNNSLTEFAFSVLKLPVVKKTDSGAPSLDKYVLEAYEATLEHGSLGHIFARSLRAKRKRDTALSYLDSYEQFRVPWVPVDVDPVTGAGWYVLHPSLNPTGTNTLRWSSSNPNEQNISKQGMFEGDKLSIRYCFGPAPGREWWSCDAKNIELRIPAYEAGEEEMIALFERPDEFPYFGSNHLLVAHVLHPARFDECLSCGNCGKEIHTDSCHTDPDKLCKCKLKAPRVDGRIFKKRYASTWYQWVKNGNFAVQYGAVEVSGTADRAYHVPGGQVLVQSRFTKQARLNKWCIAYAEKQGYIETIPDKHVDGQHGYPLLCTRTEWGKILPTVPLNYRVQGTACWWMMMAMIRCQERLDEWNRPLARPQYFMTMQVHDELVFDFPKGAGAEPWNTNLWRMRELQSLMELGGDGIGVPTPTSCEYHAESWAEGKSL